MVFGRATLCPGGGLDQHHFVVAAVVAGSRIVGDGRLPPPVVMDFRYRKTQAREIFFLRGAAIRGKEHFR
jgi:hypothetical protein